MLKALPNQPSIGGLSSPQGGYGNQAPEMVITPVDYEGIPAVLVQQPIQRKHFIAILRLAAWMAIASSDEAYIVGAVMDTDDNFIEVTATFWTVRTRQAFMEKFRDVPPHYEPPE